MTTNYARHLSPKNVPQTQPLPGESMIQNRAGGYVYEIDDWLRLKRFACLGASSGTYYASEKQLTLENAEIVLNLLKVDGPRVVREVVEISDKGLAPKNDPAIFVLALASVKGDEPTRKAAFAALPAICRIGTHLFTFVSYREALGGGWGRGVRMAISQWYTRRKASEIAYQAVKYGQRGGISHRDVLRLAHPVTDDKATRLVFDAICAPEAGAERQLPRTRKRSTERQTTSTGWTGLRETAPFIDGWLKLRAGNLKPSEAAKVIADHKLEREFVPTKLLTHAEVWEALLPNLKYTALIRNLGNLSKCGLMTVFSSAAKYVESQLSDGDAIRKARVHPWAVLLASRTYAMGRGFKGSGTWTVVPQVVAALDGAFDLSFHNVVPTGKRFILGIDVSGSMSSQVDGSPIRVCEAAAAMAMVTVRTEPQCYTLGFHHGLVDLGITTKDSLQDVMRKTAINNGGGTDCALPVRWARGAKIKADAILCYTDNETHNGLSHAHSELIAYRRELGIPLKAGFVAFTATESSLSNPSDPGSMNFVGLDASLPQALNAFVT
jgi:60 kDa SS-A/Ro ribonucleoprotein